MQLPPTAGRGRLLLALLGLALALPILAPMSMQATPAQPRSKGSGGSTGALIVRLRAGTPASVGDRIAAAAGGTELGSLDELNVRVVSASAGQRENVRLALERNPNVAAVEDDRDADKAVLPTDPHWTNQWGARLIRAPEAWRVTTGSRAVIIAIVDTGVDAHQPDLRGRLVPGWDFVNDDPNPADDDGHGTAVAGVAGAAGDNGVGIAGMCWKCRIMPVKVLNGKGHGTHSNVAAGIVWATDHGANVINLSIAARGASAVLASAVAYAIRKGVVVVAAAGNAGRTARNYPAAYPGVLSVAASNGADGLYGWSNYGRWVEIAAPGCTYTGKPGPAWTLWCGTSLATPFVAGTAALILSRFPNLPAARVERAMTRTATHIGRRVISGRLNAALALRSLGGSPP
jgi:subtilisin family serine protease